MTRGYKNRFIGISFVILLMLITFWMYSLIGCGEKEPVRIGFVGCLTGRLSDLGISGRDGVLLAVEQMNKRRGINGRRVELLIKDDRHDVKTAIRVDKELIQEGVASIIGHTTSTMSLAALPLINKEKIVMISPTASANELTGLDDYFFRLVSPNRVETDHLVSYIVKKRGLKKMSCIYDLSNRKFSEDWFHNFRNSFEKMGGRFMLTLTFTSGKDTRYLELAKELLSSEPEGILTVTGALDSAMICQQIRKLGSDIPIVTSGWARTSDFVLHGGRAVEGVIFSSAYDIEFEYRNFKVFKARFRERFGREPDFAATFGYEAAQVLLKALSVNSDPRKLKETILAQESFQGLRGDIRMDQYGDVQRGRFLLTVRDGRFVTTE